MRSVTSAGIVASVWISVSVPAAASEAKPVTVRASSLTHQANLPPGWTAKCRGPAPTATGALPWGVSVARSASNR